MNTHRLVLTQDDHVGHNIRISLPVVEMDDNDDSAVLLPEGTDFDALHVRCYECACVLLRGEDFEIEAIEPWKPKLRLL